MKRFAVASLVTACAVAATLALAQTPAPPKFPDEHLQGRPVFDLAVFYQSDLRGNFGPCG